MSEFTADLLYSRDEEDLRAAVRSLLADRADPVRLTAAAESPQGPYDPRLWTSLGTEMGLAGLLVPEKSGGAGATHREAAVVLEELGRTVAPVPFLTSAVIATEALLACEPEAAAGLLPALAAGTRTAVLAVPFSASPYGGAARTVTAAGGRLTGVVTSVADGTRADVFLVPADDGLYAVGRDAAAVEAMTSLDLTRPLARVRLDGAPGVRLTAATDAAVVRALRAGAGLLASEQLGVAEWCLTETVGYLKERRQFARRVGGFQALKHRLAQLWLQIVSARAAARYAADCLATGAADTDVAVAVAQSCAGQTAVRAAEEALQLHGGIGMTWEHPVHLYLKRAKSAQLALGSPGAHRQALAGLVDLPA
ncbi:Acyl-CoA dehydrogenase FadE27 [Streptomyces sp. RB5]|uniref:Acyl-CoA dehydrogenase FadE27 n=1 Tax=Streptomyces smaragdinus TaxID=2585196 RepID=A0A7K0CB65_9ACTN|nr:acyl-CoA dehydrogenase family protein [Streptomyces smaragdinus]MQY10701.1 Acyl-CoA dehydrogenase FadE27 [Streptomyces smaragdinus]